MMETAMSLIRKHRPLILQTLIFGLFPLICAFAYCLKDGRTPADVFLPSSYWNDELMYFKQVEAMVSLLPWAIWGRLFGWSLTSPIYANIAFNMIALGAFAILVKPGAKQSVFLLGLLATFIPYTRYMLSGMPEALCMCLGIWFVALSLSYDRDQRLWKLFALTAIVIFLTLSRPYLGLFFLVPIWFAVRRHRIWGSLGIAAAAGGLGAGVSYIFSTLLDKFSYLFGHFLKPAVKYGLFSGALWDSLRCSWPPCWRSAECS